MYCFRLLVGSRVVYLCVVVMVDCGWQARHGFVRSHCEQGIVGKEVRSMDMVMGVATM